jgi:hypothetical protein
MNQEQLSAPDSEETKKLGITPQQLNALCTLAHKLAQQLTLIVGHCELAMTNVSDDGADSAELRKILRAARCAAEDLQSWRRLVTEIEPGGATSGVGGGTF